MTASSRATLSSEKLPLSPPCIFSVTVIMARSIKRKRRGRPATGVDQLYGIRIPDNLVLAIDRWGQENDSPSRSDAIRRLVELGLSFGGKPPKVKN